MILTPVTTLLISIPSTSPSQPVKNNASPAMSCSVILLIDKFSSELLYETNTPALLYPISQNSMEQYTCGSGPLNWILCHWPGSGLALFVVNTIGLVSVPLAVSPPWTSRQVLLINLISTPGSIVKLLVASTQISPIAI